MTHPTHPWLARWGAAIARRPRRVVAVALLCLLGAVPLALPLTALLERQEDAIPHSEALALRQTLARDFTNPFIEPLLVVVKAAHLDVASPRYRAAVSAMAASLRARVEVARVAAATDPGADARLLAKDRHGSFLMVSLRGGSGERERGVEAVRAAVAPAAAALRSADPGAEIALTGAAALTHDVLAATAADSRRAEAWVLLPALALLLWVFGSPVAALLPLALGLGASLVATAGASAAAGHLSLNAHVQTTISMLGLALGIDYALLIVSRFRELRRSGLAPQAAVAGAVGTAGWTVATSGAVVLVSMGALLSFGLADATSVGLGGALVVAGAVTLALTLLPALLMLLAPWLDWPSAPGAWQPRLRWAGFARFTTRYRWPVALGAVVLLLGLAAPALHLQPGVPDTRFLPASLEAVRGSTLLAAMGRPGLTFPLLIRVVPTGGGEVLGPAGVRAMVALSGRLRRDPRVGDVLSPVDLRPHVGLVGWLLFYAHPERAIARHPAIAEHLLSRDRHAALFQVLVADGVTLPQAKGLIRDLRQGATGLELQVGGLAAQNLDYEDRLLTLLPWVVAGVFAATFCLLFAAFRSLLVPIKAIALNALAVGAALGVVTRVFQDGAGAGWLGLAGGLGTIPIIMPVLIFCLTFGLSMDYEIFMIGRVREERLLGAPGDEAGAIARGLGATGGVITAAAGIMVLVFAVFMGAQMVFVKMFGCGLAVAIALDATVVRLLLAPAVLAIAGRWNWWPGEGSPRAGATDA